MDNTNKNTHDLYSEISQTQTLDSALSSVITQELDQDDEYLHELEEKRKNNESEAKKIVMILKKKTKETGEYERFTQGYSKYISKFKDLENIVPYSNRGIPDDIKLDEEILEVFRKAVERSKKVNKKISKEDIPIFKTKLEKKQEELEKFEIAKAKLKAQARIINMTSKGISVVLVVSLPVLLFYLPGLAPFLGISPYSALATFGSSVAGVATEGGVINYFFAAAQLKELYNKRAEIYITTKKYLVNLKRASAGGKLKEYISDILIDGVVGIVSVNGVPIGYMGIDHLNISASVASVLFNCGSAALSSLKGKGSSRGGGDEDPAGWYSMGAENLEKFNFLKDTNALYNLKEGLYKGQATGMITNLITGPCKSILGQNLSSSLKLRFNGDDKPYNPPMTDEEKIIKKYEAEASKTRLLQKELNFIQNSNKYDIEIVSQLKKSSNFQNFTEYAFLQKDLLKDKLDKGEIERDVYNAEIKKLHDKSKELQSKELEEIKKKLKSGKISPSTASALIHQKINESKSLNHGINNSYYKQKAVTFVKYSLSIVAFQTVLATLMEKDNFAQLFEQLDYIPGLRSARILAGFNKEWLYNLLNRFRIESVFCEAIKNKLVVGKIIQTASGYLQKLITDYKVIENSIYYGLYTGFVFKKYTSKIIDHLGGKTDLKQPWPEENLFSGDLEKDEYDDLVKNFKIKDFFIGVNNYIPESLKNLTKWLIGKGDYKKGEERVKQILESQFIQQIGNIQVSDIFQKVIGSMVSNTLYRAANNYTNDVVNFTKNIEIDFEGKLKEEDLEDNLPDSLVDDFKNYLDAKAQGAAQATREAVDYTKAIPSKVYNKLIDYYKQNPDQITDETRTQLDKLTVEDNAATLDPSVLLHIDYSTLFKNFDPFIFFRQILSYKFKYNLSTNTDSIIKQNQDLLLALETEGLKSDDGEYPDLPTLIDNLNRKDNLQISVTPDTNIQTLSDDDALKLLSYFTLRSQGHNIDNNEGLKTHFKSIVENKDLKKYTKYYDELKAEDFLSFYGSLYTSKNPKIKEAALLGILRARDAIKYKNGDLATVFNDFVVKPALSQHKMKTDGVIDNLLTFDGSIFNSLITRITDILSGKSFVDLYEAVSNWIQETINFNKTFVEWMFTDKYDDEYKKQLIENEKEIAQLEQKKKSFNPLTEEEQNKLDELNEQISDNGIMRFLHKIFLDPKPWREQVRDSKLKKVISDFDAKLNSINYKLDFLQKHKTPPDYDKLEKELSELKGKQQEIISGINNYQTPSDFLKFEKNVFETNKNIDDFGKKLDGEIGKIIQGDGGDSTHSQIKKILFESLRDNLAGLLDLLNNHENPFFPKIGVEEQQTKLSEFDAQFNPILDDSNFVALYNDLTKFANRVNTDLQEQDRKLRDKKSLNAIKAQFNMRVKEIQTQKDDQLNLLESSPMDDEFKKSLSERIQKIGPNLIFDFDKLFTESSLAIDSGENFDASKFQDLLLGNELDELNKVFDDLNTVHEYSKSRSDFETVFTIVTHAKNDLIAYSGEFGPDVEKMLKEDTELTTLFNEIKSIKSTLDGLKSTTPTPEVIRIITEKMDGFNKKYGNSLNLNKILNKYQKIKGEINTFRNLQDEIKYSKSSDDLFRGEQKAKGLKLNEPFSSKFKTQLATRSDEISKEEEAIREAEEKKSEDFLAGLEDIKKFKEEQADAKFNELKAKIETVTDLNTLNNVIRKEVDYLKQNPNLSDAQKASLDSAIKGKQEELKAKAETEKALAKFNKLKDQIGDVTDPNTLNDVIRQKVNALKENTYLPDAQKDLLDSAITQKEAELKAKAEAQYAELSKQINDATTVDELTKLNSKILNNPNLSDDQKASLDSAIKGKQEELNKESEKIRQELLRQSKLMKKYDQLLKQIETVATMEELTNLEQQAEALKQKNKEKEEEETPLSEDQINKLKKLLKNKRKKLEADASLGELTKIDQKTLDLLIEKSGEEGEYENFFNGLCAKSGVKNGCEQFREGLKAMGEANIKIIEQDGNYVFVNKNGEELKDDDPVLENQNIKNAKDIFMKIKERMRNIIPHDYDYDGSQKIYTEKELHYQLKLKYCDNLQFANDAGNIAGATAAATATFTTFGTGAAGAPVIGLAAQTAAFNAALIGRREDLLTHFGDYGMLDYTSYLMGFRDFYNPVEDGTTSGNQDNPNVEGKTDFKTPFEYNGPSLDESNIISMAQFLNFSFKGTVTVAKKFLKQELQNPKTAEKLVKQFGEGMVMRSGLIKGATVVAKQGVNLAATASKVTNFASKIKSFAQVASLVGDLGIASICHNVEDYGGVYKWGSSFFGEQDNTNSIGEILKYMSMEGLEDNKDELWGKGHIGFNKETMDHRANFYHKNGGGAYAQKTGY
jgi:hypothetical protein